MGYYAIASRLSSMQLMQFKFFHSLENWLFSWFQQHCCSLVVHNSQRMHRYTEQSKIFSLYSIEVYRHWPLCNHTNMERISSLIRFRFVILALKFIHRNDFPINQQIFIGIVQCKMKSALNQKVEETEDQAN